MGGKGLLFKTSCIIKKSKLIFAKMNETSLGSIPKDYQSTLSYYKDKVDDLSKERMGWLSKLDECNSHLNYKQQK
jgi:hypothetical protein